MVTGAAGFIGRPLCRRLKMLGKEVRALLRPGDPKSPAGLVAEDPWNDVSHCRLGEERPPIGLMQGVHTVFHLAAMVHAVSPSPEMEQRCWDVNLAATEQLLGLAQQAGVKRFIFFSSVKAAADPRERCVDESWDLPPTDVYGMSKREAEQCVLHFGQKGIMQVCNLRPSLVYGPGVKGNLAMMIRAIAAGRFPPLPDTGNKRSMVQVEDLVQAAILAAVRPEAAGRTYIVTDGEPYSTRQIYEWICAALGRRPPRWNLPLGLLRSVARLGDGVGRLRGRRLFFDSDALAKLSGSAWYNSDKIVKELGFTPQYRLPESLPEIINSLGS